MLQLSVLGRPEPCPVGCWSFWDQVKGPSGCRGWVSSARGGQHHRGRVGVAGGVSLAWPGLFPQHMERFGFHTPLSQAGIAPMDTETALPVPGYSPTHAGHPSALSTAVAAPGHPQGCDQGAGATHLTGAIQMGRSLDLASHLPKSPQHGALGPAVPGMPSG